MANLRELLSDFHDTTTTQNARGPDEYNVGSYDWSKQRVLALWEEAYPKLKRDTEKAALIDKKLREAFAIFDEYMRAVESGKPADKALRQRGRDLFIEIYVLNPSKLR